MALCFLQEIGLADDVLVDEQDIPAPVSLLPGSYRTHLLADFCHQTSAHHVWSRRSISLKHRSPSFWCWVLKSQLFVAKFVEKEQYSFLDYISSGFELNFMVAVDFTASNGNPRNPNSLHYIDPSGRLNSYQQVRRFPAWGFGGKTFDGTVSHCFNLNIRAGGFEVDGVEGIMAAYASTLKNVSLAGLTLFGQVINTAARIAGQSLSYDRSKYFVLLIITDGVLTDLQETKDALVRASDLPLSILIVGVGGADFTQMEILDADNGRRLESSTDRVATRDIVQFVPM
ncbi:protein bonzai 3 [Citrus sinensis]|nr:protein bonzai 3 [Citrus sinensis]